MHDIGLDRMGNRNSFRAPKKVLIFSDLVSPMIKRFIFRKDWGCALPRPELLLEEFTMVLLQ
jgi:hypothetical protein